MTAGGGRSSVERIVILLSTAVLAFFYGWSSHQLGWFPSTQMREALLQAQRLIHPPAFVGSRVYDREGARTMDADRLQPGLTLIAKNWKDFDWMPGLKLIDHKGRIVHEWKADLDELFPDSAIAQVADIPRAVADRPLHGVHLIANGDVIFNIGYVGTVRLDACGRVVWRLPRGGHHSVERAEDGTFWVSAVSDEVRTRTSRYPEGFPGLNNPVYHDLILQVSGDGSILRKYNILEILYANGLERYIAKGGLFVSEDVTHLNDVESLPRSMADNYPLFEAGDLLVSLRNLDLVFVFDPDTEEVKWHASDPFIRQHDPDFIGDGWIGVFDNNWDRTARGTMLGGSRIVALQPHTDSTTVLYRGLEEEPFHSSIMGKWQKLGNENLLLTEARASRIVEVTPGGEMVWEWVGAPYSEDAAVEVTEGTRYDLTTTDVAAWPCSSEDSVDPNEEADS